MTNLTNISIRKIDGTSTSLADFKNSVLLIVNVASECGLTPQYDGLEKLYERFQSKGFFVLGFPANNFGAQEPGTNSQILAFCKTSFGVQFPLFEKISVKGEDQHPLYKVLTEAMPDLKTGKPDITWNFEKFLIGRSGKVVARFSPAITPEDPTLLQAVESELAR